MADASTKSLEALAEEIFDLTLLSWQARSRMRSPEGGPDLTELEFLTLDALVRKQPRTAGELKRILGVLPAQMSRILRSLETKFSRPLVTCSINPDDRRRVDVRTSEAGQKARDAYRAGRTGLNVAILQNLRPKDRVEFMRILRIIRAALTNQLKEK